MSLPFVETNVASLPLEVMHTICMGKVEPRGGSILHANPHDREAPKEGRIPIRRVEFLLGQWESRVVSAQIALSSIGDA